MENKNNSLLKFALLSETLFWDYYSLSNREVFTSNFSVVKLKEVLKQRKGSITINDDLIYKRCRVQVDAKGVVLRDEVQGVVIKTKKQQVCKADDFLVAEIDAKVGGYGIVPLNLDQAIVSGHYFLFEIDKTKLLPEYLELVIKQPEFFKQIKATGSTNYAAIRPYHVLGYEIPLPKIDIQKKIIETCKSKSKTAKEQEDEASMLQESMDAFLYNELGLTSSLNKKEKKFFKIIQFANVNEWGIDKLNNLSNFNSKIHHVTSFELSPILEIEIFRGKSPKYSDNSPKTILNQKCNRWNFIDVSFAKKVDESWYNSVNSDFLTKEGDVLINSTGEGTIGRASLINKLTSNLLYDSHLLLLRVNKSLLDPLFYTYVFNSKYGQSQVDNIKSAQTTKQTELGVGNLRKILFPLPSLREQKEIVNHIENLKDRMKSLLELSQQNRSSAIEDFRQKIFK